MCKHDRRSVYVQRSGEQLAATDHDFGFTTGDVIVAQVVAPTIKEGDVNVLFRQLRKRASKEASEAVIITVENVDRPACADSLARECADQCSQSVAWIPCLRRFSNAVMAHKSTSS